MGKPYKAMQEGYINGKFVVIITDHGDAGIVERSKPWNIPLIVIERSDYDSKTSFEQDQLDALEPYKGRWYRFGWIYAHCRGLH